jgi:sulfite dehydrogenase
MDRRACLLLVVVIALGAAWGYARGGRQAAAEVPAAVTVTATPPAAATPEPEPAGTPRQVFAHSCGMCHSLKAAGTRGFTGPDLDELRPTAARVRRMVRTGSLDGVMQPGLLQGEQARAVARYVARASRG